MRYLRRKFNIILYISIISVFALTSYAYSQNFGNFGSSDNVDIMEDDDALTDDVLKQILLNEGIPLTSPEGIEGSKYTLGIDDVIEIVVSRHPEVSGQYLINGEGKIQYEFVGDILVSGLTKDEVAEVLKDKLSKYIISPEVLVKITGYNSKVVYVIGEVGRPGKIYMKGDTISVREALVQAALPLLSAKGSKTLLITPSDDGRPNREIVNIDKLLYKGDLRENLVMKPGDTLYVPPTLMAKTLRAIQPVAAPISTAAGTGRTVTTGF